MNELTTEIIAALAQKQDLDEVFRKVRDQIEQQIIDLAKVGNL